MRWSAALVALVAACSSKSSPPSSRRDGGVAHDPGGDATPAAPARPRPKLDAQERANLPGTIYASSGAENAFAVVAIDPSGTNATRTLSPPGGSWYPTPNRVPLAIVTHDDADQHTEQLVDLRATPPALLGKPSKFVRYPTASRDGTFVVFESDPDSFRDLYRLSLDDGALVRLTDEPSGSFEPTLSADDTRVAFTSSRDGNAELYVLDLATKRTTRLTTAPSDDWNAVWSPAGEALVFLSDRDAGLPRLYVTSASGGEAEPLHVGAARGEEGNAVWSPDGTQVAFTVTTRDGASEIWVTTVGTGAAQRISAPGSRDEAPSWSPDGQHLVYVSTRDRRIDLYVARRDGSAEARITDTPDEEWIPRWLPTTL